MDDERRTALCLADIHLSADSYPATAPEPRGDHVRARHAALSSGHRLSASALDTPAGASGQHHLITLATVTSRHFAACGRIVTRVDLVLGPGQLPAQMVLGTLLCGGRRPRQWGWPLA
jgi:hypothetical protein